MINFQQDLRNIDVNSITPADIDVQLDATVVLNAGPLAKHLVQMWRLTGIYMKIAKWPSFSASPNYSSFFEGLHSPEKGNGEWRNGDDIIGAFRMWISKRRS